MVPEDFAWRIKTVLNELCSEKEPLVKSGHFLNTLGYESERTFPNQLGDLWDLLEDFMKLGTAISYDYTLIGNVEKMWFIFEVQEDEIKQLLRRSYTGVKRWNEGSGNATCLRFFTVELTSDSYGYATLAEMVHSINRANGEPCVVLFKYADRLSIGTIARRLNKRDDSKDVRGKISLIKDINLREPSSAHLDKLEQLSLTRCQSWLRDNNLQHDFDGLLKAWLRVADGYINLTTEFVPKKYGNEYFRQYNSVNSMICQLDNSKICLGLPSPVCKLNNTSVCLGLPSSHCEENLAHWNQYH